MDRSRKIIITLIIVVTILIIALAGVIIYFTLVQNKDKGNSNIVLNTNLNTIDEDNSIENTMENVDLFDNDGYVGVNSMYFYAEGQILYFYSNY